MCVNLSPAAAATAAAVSVVVMVIPVWVVEVMVPFSSSLSPDGVSLVMMLAYLRTIDVEILNVFSLESGLLKPLKYTVGNQLANVIRKILFNLFSPGDLQVVLQSHQDRRCRTRS